MPINSSAPLNINIQINKLSDPKSAEISASVASPTADIQAPKNFAGRTVTLIRDVSNWAAGETKAYAQWVTKGTVKDIKAGAAFVAKKFSEAIRSLHEKFQIYRADRKANKEWKLSEARAEHRHSEGNNTKVAFRLQPQRSETQSSAHPRRLDQETKDIQTRLNLLKLPDVPNDPPKF